MNSGQEVVAVIALGMGLVFWLTDIRSPISRALALFLSILGAAIYANSFATLHALDPQLPNWIRFVGLLDALTFIAGCQWALRVSRTAVAVGQLSGRLSLMRFAQVLALIYAALVALLPDLRYRELALAFSEGRWPSVWFLLFLVPSIVAGVLVSISGVMLLRLRPDGAERVRVLGGMAAMPVLAAALVTPAEYAPLVLAVGEVIFLYGALRYYIIQGARGTFMAQFLSPQVAELVRTRGMRHAMARKRMEVSVVCCDIRRFTAHAQGHTPEQVMRLLRAFYAAVGAAAQEFGGTVKDLAGDGALVLIGAPVAYEDRAQRAIALARRLQQRVRPVIRRFSSEIGLGVGVASGSVAVGIVGESGRYEYMAVGPAVNLASRLCDKAGDGEIHIDETTLRESGESIPAQKRRRYVKGIDKPVTTFVLGDARVRRD